MQLKTREGILKVLSYAQLALLASKLCDSLLMLLDRAEGKKGTKQKQKAGKAKARSPKESIEQDDEKDAKHVSEPDSTMPTRTRSRKRAAADLETASDSDAATARQGAKGKF